MTESEFENKSLDELQAQLEALQEEIHQRQKAEVAQAKAQIREIAAKHGLEVEIRVAGRKEAKEREPAKAKYRNPETGESWSGRGRSPKWLVEAIEQGKKKEDFLIGDEE